MSGRAIAAFILATLGVLGLLLWQGAKTATPVVKDKTDPTRPVVQVDTTSADLGEMTTAEVREKTFTLRNVGQSELNIISVSTSCDCTYAYVTAGGQTSPRFSMHGTTRWQGKVRPGETAEVSVSYEPAIMPVQGPVKRVVTVTTDDPVTPRVELTVTAKVRN